MEKVMSVEERIRRAENIYNRRNGGYMAISTDQKKSNKSKRTRIKKLLMQVFICIFVYVIFYTVTNREYIFSDQFRSEVNLFFTEKTKISEWYSNAKSFVYNRFKLEENIQSVNNLEETDDDSKKENIEEIKNETEHEEEKSNDEKEKNTDSNIGGADETSSNEELSEQELMEKTAKEIKEKISFILPISGRISSTFGWRNPTTESVPKYHTGIDIAAAEGTVIKSATDGKVIMVSSQGDYGNHYQIQIDDIIIVYAHCKKLYLKEGDNVRQGQKIAEVGTTGNSTGPHLHFEIRKGDMKIDPQLILNF